MTSICYQTTIEQNIVDFPNKKKLQKTNKIPIVHSSPNFDVFNAEDRFDPNITSSPPNVFINMLQQRIDVYYTNMNDINVGNHARNRTLSFGK